MGDDVDALAMDVIDLCHQDTEAECLSLRWISEATETAAAQQDRRDAEGPATDPQSVCLRRELAQLQEQARQSVPKGLMMIDLAGQRQDLDAYDAMIVYDDAYYYGWMGRRSGSRKGLPKGLCHYPLGVPEWG